MNGKPCPFCGEPDPVIDEIDRGCFAVCCNDCGAIGPIVKHEDSQEGARMALEAWDKRTAGNPA